LTEFRAECLEQKLPIDENLEENEENLDESNIRHLLQMFDCVYEDAFFKVNYPLMTLINEVLKVWDDVRSVPHALDTSSFVKLNFRLHLYFACRKIEQDLAPSNEVLKVSN